MKLNLNIDMLKRVLEEELCHWIDEKDIDELLEKGELVPYDEECVSKYSLLR